MKTQMTLMLVLNIFATHFLVSFSLIKQNFKKYIQSEMTKICNAFAWRKLYHSFDWKINYRYLKWLVIMLLF